MCSSDLVCETDNDKVFALTAALHDEGIAVAFLAEANLRPGAVWPERECGFGGAP